MRRGVSSTGGKRSLFDPTGASGKRFDREATRQARASKKITRDLGMKACTNEGRVEWLEGERVVVREPCSRLGMMLTVEENFYTIWKKGEGSERKKGGEHSWCVECLRVNQKNQSQIFRNKSELFRDMYGDDLDAVDRDSLTDEDKGTYDQMKSAEKQRERKREAWAMRSPSNKRTKKRKTWSAGARDRQSRRLKGNKNALGSHSNKGKELTSNHREAIASAQRKRWRESRVE